MHFHLEGKSSQFTALAFGLSTAPNEFTVVAEEIKFQTSEGCKNPPVPRRLIGQIQMPPSLSTAYQNTNVPLPGPRLDGEQEKNQSWNPNKFLTS